MLVHATVLSNCERAASQETARQFCRGLAVLGVRLMRSQSNWPFPFGAAYRSFVHGVSINKALISFKDFYGERYRPEQGARSSCPRGRKHRRHRGLKT